MVKHLSSARLSSSSLTGRTAMEALYDPAHPLTTDETTACVCQPQKWRKPGIRLKQPVRTATVTCG